MEKHVPLKKKIVRRNHAPFITKDLRKAIYTRSRLKSKYIKNPSEVNKKLYKRQRNKCVSIRKKSMKQYFSNITSKGTVTNREFWKTMKPFLTNKGFLDNSDIMLRGDNEMKKLSVTMKTLIRKWSYITLSESMKIILV